jgi:hypothetical protein
MTMSGKLLVSCKALRPSVRFSNCSVALRNAKSLCSPDIVQRFENRIEGGPVKDFWSSPMSGWGQSRLSQQAPPAIQCPLPSKSDRSAALQRNVTKGQKQIGKLFDQLVGGGD